MSRAEPVIRIVGHDGDVFLVESGERTYRVNPNRGSCDCQAGARHRSCRHYRLVLDTLESGARSPG